ncbi:MAG: extracellular solute-binding protein [Roseiflexaceae bacterium]
MDAPRRGFSVLLVGILVASFLAACGAPSAGSTAATSAPAAPTAASAAQATPASTTEELSGEMTISVEAWMVDKYNMKELVARFEKAHPKAKVKLLTHEGLGANYLNIFLEWEQTKKSTADLYFGGLISQISPAIIDDQLLPWDEIMTGELARDKWIPAFLQYSYVPGPAGSQYPTLPGLGEAMNFQVNTKYLKEIGKLDANGKPVMPTSYQEIMDYACKLAQVDVSGKKLTGLEMEYGLNFAPDSWMAAVVAAEASYLLPDGKINWDSQAGKDWIAFQKQIADKKCGGTLTFTDNNGARNGLKAGQVAIINASNSRSTEANAVLGPNVVRMFDYPGGKGTLAFSHQIYIPRAAANPKLAQAFAREAILGEYGQTWSAEQFGKMPTLWANYDALAQTDSNFALVRKELEGPTQGQWLYRDGQALRKAYVDELQSYMTGAQSIDDMIKNLKQFQDEADLAVPGKK